MLWPAQNKMYVLFKSLFFSHTSFQIVIHGDEGKTAVAMKYRMTSRYRSSEKMEKSHEAVAPVHGSSKLRCIASNNWSDIFTSSLMCHNPA